MKVKNTNKKEAPPKFLGRLGKGGGLKFGMYVRAKLKEFIKENPNMPFELKPILPESSNQRAFFEGGICTLVAFYQEGMDHRDYKDRNRVRDWLKIEFNGEIVEIMGKGVKIAKSTKNVLNQGFLERVIDWLIENYQPPMEVLDPNKYKHWRDVVFPVEGADNYIDYLVELNILK